MSEVEQRRLRIKELNDALRSKFEGGQVYYSQGFLALDERVKAEAVNAVMGYEFDDEDTEDEHDLGTVRIQSQTVVFKIDYYSDTRLKFMSADPFDSGRTIRVLSILLLGEW